MILCKSNHLIAQNCLFSKLHSTPATTPKENNNWNIWWTLLFHCCPNCFFINSPCRPWASSKVMTPFEFQVNCLNQTGCETMCHIVHIEIQNCGKIWTNLLVLPASGAAAGNAPRRLSLHWKGLLFFACESLLFIACYYIQQIQVSNVAMGAIPRFGAAQPRGQNKGICSNYTLVHARSSLRISGIPLALTRRRPGLPVLHLCRLLMLHQRSESHLAASSLYWQFGEIRTQEPCG